MIHRPGLFPSAVSSDWALLTLHKHNWQIRPLFQCVAALRELHLAARHRRRRGGLFLKLPVTGYCANREMDGPLCLSAQHPEREGHLMSCCCYPRIHSFCMRNLYMLTCNYDCSVKLMIGWWLGLVKRFVICLLLQGLGCTIIQVNQLIQIVWMASVCLLTLNDVTDWCHNDVTDWEETLTCTVTSR